jgi:dynein heavy chain
MGVRDERWIVFDGPTTGQWTKYLSLVYGEEATLCSAELERLRLPLSARIKFIFESASIAHLSPQLISRCGVLFFDEQSLGHSSVLEKWIMDLRHRDEETASLVAKCLEPVVETCIAAFPLFEQAGSLVRHNPSPVLVLGSALGLLGALLAMAHSQQQAALHRCVSVAGSGSAPAHSISHMAISSAAHSKRLESLVVFACSWGFGSVLSAKQKQVFGETLLKRLQVLRLAQSLFATLPIRASIFDMSFDIEAGEWASWSDSFRHDDIGPSNMPGGYVPILRQFPIEQIMRLAISAQAPLLLFGPSQSGKSAMLERVYRTMDNKFEHLTYNLRGISHPQRLQRILESHTVHHGRSGRGPPLGHHLMVVVEDLNVRGHTASACILLGTSMCLPLFPLCDPLSFTVTKTAHTVQRSFQCIAGAFDMRQCRRYGLEHSRAPPAMGCREWRLRFACCGVR